jgi:hypothetical protein
MLLVGQTSGVREKQCEEVHACGEVEEGREMQMNDLDPGMSSSHWVQNDRDLRRHLAGLDHTRFADRRHRLMVVAYGRHSPWKMR